MNGPEQTKIDKPAIVPGDFTATRGNEEAAEKILANLDPGRPLEREDARGDTQVDWAEEERRGNAVRVRYIGDKIDSSKGHIGAIGGQPQTRKQIMERRRTFETMQHITDTGRLPTPGDGESRGTIFSGGYSFKRGVPKFMDHAPFEGKEGS